MNAVGVDVGGTKIAAGVVSPEGRLLNEVTYPTADVISTYLFRIGLESNSFSYAAAIGLFEAIIGLTLILSANAISRRTVGASLW